MRRPPVFKTPGAAKDPAGLQCRKSGTTQGDRLERGALAPALGPPYLRRVRRISAAASPTTTKIAIPPTR